MKKKFLKNCSVFLILVLLMNMLPISVWAEKETETVAAELIAENAADELPQAEDLEQAYILQEIVEKRTETSKEFLLSNGLHMAALYAEPVHYQTESGWQEIDNTLIAKP